MRLLKKSRPDNAVRILGVDYLHRQLRNGDDVYVTDEGRPFVPNVLYPDWYKSDCEYIPREKLRGTGSLYRLHTRDSGLLPIDLVIKWCRIGQEVPGQDHGVSSEYSQAEFNSPFEEFALLKELRSARPSIQGDSSGGSRSVRTHRPLGVYVPSARVDPERQGRKGYLFDRKARHDNVELDLYRQYIMVYEWIKGLDVVQASEIIPISDDDIRKLTLKAELALRRRGFQDFDRKPHHLIVRVGSNERLIKDRNHETLYAHIDFEMLHRTSEREAKVKASRRHEYLVRQRDRFDPVPHSDFPPHLSQVTVMGVDYIYGRVESTGGALWVVGRDPALFDYFLPERWRRTPRRKLSHASQVYHTTSKDSIHLVWRVSRVGERPDIYPGDAAGKDVLEYGYNSPFEEFSIALDLERRGIRTIYPRAIYQTGTATEASEGLSDKRRYRSHRRIVMPDGSHALRPDRTYIVVWGHWNGPDELLAVRDGEYYTGLNLRHAFRDGIISPEELQELTTLEKVRLHDAGVEDLYLQPEHFMISRDHDGTFIRDREGRLELRVCDFELLKRRKHR